MLDFYSEIIEFRATEDLESSEIFAKTGPLHHDGGMFRGGLGGGLAYEEACTRLAAEWAPGRSISTVLGCSTLMDSEATLFTNRVQSDVYHPGWATHVSAAVDWLVRFQESLGPRTDFPRWVNRHSFEFLTQWIEPLAERASAWSERLDLTALRQREWVISVLSDDARLLSTSPMTTLIHGDLYASNTLLTPQGIAVVDWELCAVACGAVDFATLTLGWDPAIVRTCDDLYLAKTSSRLDISPAEVSQMVAAARRHVVARIIGALPEPQEHDSRALKKYARRLGLLAQLLSGIEPSTFLASK